MNRLYIIVTVNNSSYKEQSFTTRSTDREVLAYTGILASRGGLEDDIEIKRIFSVDEYGKVQHYGIEFKNGKLYLVEVLERKM